MFAQKLPASYHHLDIILAARLLAIRSDARGLSGGGAIPPNRTPLHDDFGNTLGMETFPEDHDHEAAEIENCACRVCLPPGPERERVLRYHQEDAERAFEMETGRLLGGEA